jgi:hypothetical protein
LDAGQTPHLGLTGFVFSISERSADISWLPRVPVSQAAAGAAAAAGVAAPDGRPGPPDAAAEAAVGPAEAVAAPALLSEAPGAVAVAAAVQPGVRVLRGRPAEWALEPAQQAWLTAVAAAQRPFVCRVSSGYLRLRHQTPLRSATTSSLRSSSSIWFQGQAFRWGSLRPEQVPSCPGFSGYPPLRRRSPVRSETASRGSQSPICFPG